MNNRQDFERFAVQYWGQEVGVTSDIEMGQNTIEYHQQAVNMENIEVLDYLSLRSIESLTDEELISLCMSGYKLAFQGNNYPSKWKVTKSKYNFASVKCKYSDYSFEIDLNDFTVDIHLGEELSNSFNPIAFIDHTRSIGILVPFDKYSVEEILSLGWAVVKK